MKEEEIPPSGGVVIQLFPKGGRKTITGEVSEVTPQKSLRPDLGEGLPDEVKQNLQQPVEIQPAGNPIKKQTNSWFQVLRNELNEGRKYVYIGMFAAFVSVTFFLGLRRIFEFFRILFNFVLDFILFILSLIF